MLMHLMEKDPASSSEADKLLHRAYLHPTTVSSVAAGPSAFVEYASEHGNHPVREVVREVLAGSVYHVKLGKGQEYCDWFQGTCASVHRGVGDSN